MMAMRDQARERIVREMERAHRFTIRQIADATGAKYDTACRVTWELCRNSSVRRDAPKRNGHRGGCAVYVFEHGPAALVANARYRIWRAMRIMRRFQISNLIGTAVAGENNTQKYVFELTKAGYLRIVRSRQAGVRLGAAVYMLVRDTGPLPPRVHRDGSVFDPNATSGR